VSRRKADADKAEQTAHAEEVAAVRRGDHATAARRELDTLSAWFAALALASTPEENGITHKPVSRRSVSRRSVSTHHAAALSPTNLAGVYAATHGVILLALDELIAYGTEAECCAFQARQVRDVEVVRFAATPTPAPVRVTRPHQDREPGIIEYVMPPTPRPERGAVRDTYTMIKLCRSFPSLDRPDLPEPWDARTFEAWSRKAWATSGSVQAARFVLAVWSGKAYDRDDRVRTLAAVEDDDGTWPTWDKREGGVPTKVTAPTCEAIRPLWTVGAFDAIQAMGSWDETHRAAFIAWCAAPWWP